jgi:hypothetical protein
MAGPTRLELATSCVTGRRSNQLNYDPAEGCFCKCRARRPRAAILAKQKWPTLTASQTINTRENGACQPVFRRLEDQTRRNRPPRAVARSHRFSSMPPIESAAASYTPYVVTTVRPTGTCRSA